jgi:hypothetical protein
VNLCREQSNLSDAVAVCIAAQLLRFATLLLLPLLLSPPAEAEPSAPDIARAILAAYPDFLQRVDGNELVWKDGTRMQIDDHAGRKNPDDLLAAPDIKDMFLQTYPAGEKGIPPPSGDDPGRVRYLPLFIKMYGDCRKNEVVHRMVDVVWLRTKGGDSVKFSHANGAAAALQRVSDELDKLPERFLPYLKPTQGTYNCRPIAGTDRPSAHGLGIAIDLASVNSDYWLWSKPDATGTIPYKNRVPWEIVLIFEKHGFVWGGKWYHYDTMHFEYRPDLLLLAR